MEIRSWEDEPAAGYESMRQDRSAVAAGQRQPGDTAGRRLGRARRLGRVRRPATEHDGKAQAARQQGAGSTKARRDGWQQNATTTAGRTIAGHDG